MLKKTKRILRKFGAIYVKGLNEMYASLYSGVLRYNLNDSSLRKELVERNYKVDSNGKKKTSMRRNCFNNYQQSKYF